MKKNYIEPKCVCIEIEAEDMMATSPGISSNGYSDPTEDGLAKERYADFDDYVDLY